MPSILESIDPEAVRIQQAYARRKRNHLYSRFNPAYLFMVQERERRLLRLLGRYGYTDLSDKKVLEVGCGNGDVLRDFIKWGARPENVTGIDLLSDRVAEAIELCPGLMEIQQGNAVELPFNDRSFDLVMQSTVFTSILDPSMKERIALEMLRVLKPGGLVLWYDYHMNNPKNRDVRGVKRREIDALFPNCEIDLEPITLAPPLARFLAHSSLLVCYLLSTIPWLCTHYIGVIHKSRM